MNSEKRRSRTYLFALIPVLTLLLLTGCNGTQQTKTGASEGAGSAAEVSLPETTNTASEKEVTEIHSTEPEAAEETDKMFYAHVNEKVLKILAAENSSADAFLEQLKTGDVTVEIG